jgi:acetyl-CoA C-acetyltransferase
VAVPQRKGVPFLVDSDESPRRDTRLDALRVLKPAFKAGGTVTAGNAPGITDGAAALVLARRGSASKLGLKALARVTASAQVAVKPLEIFTAPVHALRKLAAHLEITPQDFDLVELNEAFPLSSSQY